MRSLGLENVSCAIEDIFSPEYLTPMPHLYPFTIEFNLLLTGVWFIVLQNIGKYGRHKDGDFPQSQRTTEKNLVISADCHSANRGIFAGIVVLLASIVVMVIFHVTVLSEEHNRTGVVVYLVQNVVLVFLAFVACILAYGRMTYLDINAHPITLLNDFLLCIPLPFYFVHGILVVIAEMQNGGSSARIVLQVSSAVVVFYSVPVYNLECSLPVSAVAGTEVEAANS